MADDVGYVTKGPPGHQCADCQHYEPDTDDPSVGKCMGEDVESGASCNYFESKESSAGESSPDPA